MVVADHDAKATVGDAHLGGHSQDVGRDRARAHACGEDDGGGGDARRDGPMAVEGDHKDAKEAADAQDLLVHQTSRQMARLVQVGEDRTEAGQDKVYDHDDVDASGVGLDPLPIRMTQGKSRSDQRQDSSAWEGQRRPLSRYR